MILNCQRILTKNIRELSSKRISYRMSQCILKNIGTGDARGLPDIIISSADKRKVSNFLQCFDFFFAAKVKNKLIQTCLLRYSVVMLSQEFKLQLLVASIYC